MNKACVAAWQMVSSSEWSDNQASLARGFAQAAHAGVKLLLIPENAAIFGAAAQLAEAGQIQLIMAWLSEQARQHELTLIAGTLPLRQRPDGVTVPEGRVRSATLVFGPDGTLLGRYDKRHLFDVDVADAQGRYQESATFEPGDDIALIETPVGRVGVLTCYDLRFPEQARHLRRLGADIVVVPASFTAVTGEAHWQVLLRARAIENQCLVIAAGQGGQHSEQRKTWGHSQVINAWGEVLAERHESGEGLVTALYDESEQHELRRRMPVEQHRRD